MAEVRCHSGYRADEEPRRFDAGAGWREVVEILDRGRHPGHRSWQVRADDGCVYVIRHFESGDRWEIQVRERKDRRSD